MAKTKYIETPEKMWEYFLEYVQKVKSSPRKKNDFAGKDANEVIKLLEVPLTMEGFLNYLDERDIITDATDYFENKDGRYSKYVRICQRVKRVIRQDQIEGGMVGIYTPSITQRINGLVEKQETKTEHSGDISVTLNIT
jgi:hypothetical protein